MAVAPLVLVKTQTGQVDYHYQGSFIPWLSDEQRDRFLAEELVVEADADDVPQGADKPKKTATQKAWADYAVSQGADRAEADSATREELIELYGDK